MMMNIDEKVERYICFMCGSSFLDDPDYVGDHGFICVDCAEMEPLDMDDED